MKDHGIWGEQDWGVWLYVAILALLLANAIGCGPCMDKGKCLKKETEFIPIWTQVGDTGFFNFIPSEKCVAWEHEARPCEETR